MENSEEITSSTHSFAYYIDYSRTVLSKLQKFLISYLSYGLSKLHQIFTEHSQFFFNTLSIELHVT